MVCQRSSALKRREIREKSRTPTELLPPKASIKVSRCFEAEHVREVGVQRILKPPTARVEGVLLFYPSEGWPRGASKPALQDSG